MLLNYELKIRFANQTVTRQIEDEQAYRDALQTYFGIVLPDGAQLKLPTA